jgi:hypothetical protein
MKKVLFYLVLSVFIFIACNPDELSLVNLKGKWVETSSYQDTLILSGGEKQGMLTLNRPKENQNGKMLPHHGDGMYSYSIEKDSIKLQYAILSCFCPKSYFFQLNKSGEMLSIGNFYNDDIPTTEILIFKHL